MNTFLVISNAGPNRDFSKDTREQPYWDDHASFVDALVADGFIRLGGPLTDDGGAVLVVNAGNEDDVRTTLEPDPWYQHGILSLESVRRWQIFIDEWAKED